MVLLLISVHLPSLDCVLGPAGDEDKDNDPQHLASSHPPPVHPFAHNAFHVWDQDDVFISLPHDESPQTSPLLLAAIPYIPSFFPLSQSPTSHGSLASPGPTREISMPREIWFEQPPWAANTCRCFFVVFDVARKSLLSYEMFPTFASRCTAGNRSGRFFSCVSYQQKSQTLLKREPKDKRDYWRWSLDIVPVCLSFTEKLFHVRSGLAAVMQSSVLPV